MSALLKCRDVGILILASVFAAGTSQKSATGNQPLEIVSLCQLTERWEPYDHKTVRIEAIYHTGPEISELYDPGCAKSDRTAWVKLLPSGSPSPVPGELKAKLGELLKQNGRARITVVGEFDGPQEVNVPSGASPQAAAAMRDTDSRYGHMNGWKFQFVFSKIEKVEAVRASERWPSLFDGAATKK